MKLTELLEQVDRLDQEAEAGPWGHERAVNTENGWSLGTVRSDRTGESVAPEVYDPDGAFIALARTALPAMSKALRAVTDLEDESLDGDLMGYEIDQYIGHNQALQSVREAITDAMEGDNETH